MTSMNQRLSELKTALVAVSSKCYHYFAPSSAKAPYIVWNEDSEDSSLMVDGRKARQALSGYVEYYTRTEFDAKFDAIQEALEGLEGLSWTWESTIYGDPTQSGSSTTDLIHHTWSWRMF